MKYMTASNALRVGFVALDFSRVRSRRRKRPGFWRTTALIPAPDNPNTALWDEQGLRFQARP